MTDTPAKKTFRQVCTFENCGNEAEMIITCSLEAVDGGPEAGATPVDEPQPAKNKVPGQAVCTHCGNEAEILVDL